MPQYHCSHTRDQCKRDERRYVIIRLFTIDSLQDFVKFDNVGGWREPLQSLDFPKVIDLINIIEMILHTLDRRVLTILDRLFGHQRPKKEVEKMRLPPQSVVYIS